MAWLDPNNTVEQRQLNRHISRAVTELRTRDPVIERLAAGHGRYRLRTTTNFFQVMLETVISQQLSTSAARSIYARLLALLGRRTARPTDILTAKDTLLRQAGLSRAKAAYVRNVADAFARGRMGPKTFAALDDGEVVARLTAIKGVGEWSAHMFLIFALNRLDVFPIGDLGLRNALAAQYGVRAKPPYKRLVSIGDGWRPYRTVGTLYLWLSYDGI